MIQVFDPVNIMTKGAGNTKTIAYLLYERAFIGHTSVRPRLRRDHRPSSTHRDRHHPRSAAVFKIFTEEAR